MSVFHAVTIGRGVVLLAPTADGNPSRYLRTDSAGSLSFNELVAIGSP